MSTTLLPSTITTKPPTLPAIVVPRSSIMHFSSSHVYGLPDVETTVEVHEWWLDPVPPADMTSSAIVPVFETYYNWPDGTYEHDDLRQSSTAPYARGMDDPSTTTSPTVIYPAPSPHPVYLDPLACSSHAGMTSGRLVQRYPPDAVATAALGGMSTRASDYSSLTNWAGADTTEGPAQPVPAQPAPEGAVMAVPEHAAPGARRPSRPRKRHSTEKTYYCPYPACPYSTAREYNLNAHIRAVHLGERPFPCPACAETFKKKHDMQRHYQSFHTTLGSPRNNIPCKR